jgi:hypothetical protein
MKILLVSALLILPIFLFSVPLNESFSSVNFPPLGWKVINNDSVYGGLYSWERYTTNPRTPPACVSSKFEGSGIRNDDWLITPKLFCQYSTADTLNFWYRKSLTGGLRESLEVRLSTTGNNINDFNFVLWVGSFTTTIYTHKTLSLDSFDGNEVYIAFVNKGQNQTRINLDDITGPPMAEICDVGVDSVISSYRMRPAGAGFYPQAVIRNYGNTMQRDIPVVCSIFGESSALRYQSVKYIDSLFSDSIRNVVFDLFVPAIAELCTIKVSTFLANDSNAANNTKRAAIEIYFGQYTGGPDNGFYYWIDSDTSGGPTYNWIDISSSGTPLVSGDAYVAGPITIDFPFNYYGEAKQYFWYSTNGFITLDEISLSYNTNSPIPSSNLPNSLIAPFWDDLFTYQARHQTFGSSPNRYKVVQWKSIIYAQAVLRDTVIFQVILHENGDIVFQYNYCSNRYNLGLGQSATIGIENPLGSSGLQYLCNDSLPGNRISAERAVRFYRSCHDVALDTILTGYVGISDTIFPKVVVKNTGTFPETFSGVLNIRDNAQTLIYADTLEVISLLPTVKCTLVFKRWIPAQFGTYPAKAWTVLVGDDYPFNDTAHQDIMVTLAAPVLLQPGNAYITNNRLVSFDWSDVYQASRYNLVINGVVDTITNFSQYGPRNFSEGIFTWQVRAGNYNTWGLWSQTYTFTVDTTRPQAPILIAPPHNCTLLLTRPNFIWHQASDAAQYNILIYSSYDTVINQMIPDTNYIPTQAIPNGRFFWKVRSIDLAGNWSDYSQTRTFTLQYQVWYQKADIPESNSYKPVGAGGALTVSDNQIYAIKGNNTQDFYVYDPLSDQWNIEPAIPYFNDSVIRKRKVKAGGALSCGNGLVFAIKGNNTKEFWVYDIGQGIWFDKQPITSTNKLRQGSCLCYDNGSVYCLVGNSIGFEFFRYDVLQDSWIKLSLAPAGRFNKRFKDGSCLTATSNGKIYALKGGSRLNEFYVYDINTDVWTEKESLPYFHPLIRKKTKVKAGGALVYDGQNCLYALKGGGKNEFWQYNVVTGQWFGLETIPKLNRRSAPKAGASLAFLNGWIFVLKGNRTREFWAYQASLDKLYYRGTKTPSNTEEVVFLNQVQSQNNKNRIIQKLVKAGTSNSVLVNFGITNPGHYVLNLCDLNGRIVKDAQVKFLPAGNRCEEVFLDNLPNGVYFIVLEKSD